MEITSLVENTTWEPGLEPEHGLSLYIRTDTLTIVADTGQSGRALLENAAALGKDLSRVNMCFISHGHYDHAGGLTAFAEAAPQARIYMHEKAAGRYYGPDGDSTRYIGIDPAVMKLPQLTYTKGHMRLGPDVETFDGAAGRRLWPAGNLVLKEKIGDELVQDEFLHEQYLRVRSKNTTLLVSGCAHQGILNIMDRYRELYGEDPGIVVSGFHMMADHDLTADEISVIEETARQLQKTDTTFYTCHCTGEPAFEIMHDIMGEQIDYLRCGETIMTYDG